MVMVFINSVMGPCLRVISKMIISMGRELSLSKMGIDLMDFGSMGLRRGKDIMFI